MNFRRGAMIVLLAVVAVPAAQAQWVMVARAVSGRIQRMEQQTDGQQRRLRRGHRHSRSPGRQGL